MFLNKFIQSFVGLAAVLGMLLSSCAPCLFVVGALSRPEAPG
jgi:hypothetical protein